MGVATVATFLAVLILAVSSEPHDHILKHQHLKQHRNEHGLSRQHHFSNIRWSRDYNGQSKPNYGRGNDYIQKSNTGYEYGLSSQKSEAEISQDSHFMRSGQTGQFKYNYFDGDESSARQAKQYASQIQRTDRQFKNEDNYSPYFPNSPQSPQEYGSNQNHQYLNGKRTGQTVYDKEFQDYLYDRRQNVQNANSYNDDTNVNTLYSGQNFNINDGNIETENSAPYATDNQQDDNYYNVKTGQTKKQIINQTSSSSTAISPNQYNRNRFRNSGNYNNDEVTGSFGSSNDYRANREKDISGGTGEISRSSDLSREQESFGERRVGLQDDQSNLADFYNLGGVANDFRSEEYSFGRNANEAGTYNNQNQIVEREDGVGNGNLEAYAIGGGSDGSEDGAGNNFHIGQNGGFDGFTWGAASVTDGAGGYTGGADYKSGEDDYPDGVGNYNGEGDDYTVGADGYKGGAGDYTGGIGGNAGGVGGYSSEADDYTGRVGDYKTIVGDYKGGAGFHTGGAGRYRGEIYHYRGGIGGYRGRAGGAFGRIGGYRGGAGGAYGGIGGYRGSAGGAYGGIGGYGGGAGGAFSGVGGYKGKAGGSITLFG